MAPPSRQLCAFYFTPVIINDTAKTGHWTCNKCGKDKLKSGGWTNLLNHARSCVGPSFESDFERLHHLSGKNSAITSFVIRVNETEREMYKWIEWVIMKNQPLSIVDDPLTREGMRYRPVTSKLLRQNILLLCKEMQASIKRKLPDKFALIFDGWTEGTIHYIGVSASYVTMVDSKEVVAHSLLSMRPLLTGDIQGMTATDHLHHLSKTLQTYGKSDANIVCLIGDNCSVNKCTSRLLKVPLIGCGSHKFNLAVRKWISNQPQLEDIISKVASVMRKASTLKVSAQLRKLTSLHTVKENDTRWSSTFNMVDRFFQIQTELSAVADLIPLIPTLVECDLLAKGFVHLKHFNQITVLLQEEGITFLRVREIFDTMLEEDYPELSGHLATDAEIVENVEFERAVVKIAKGLILTEEQRESVRGLMVPAASVGTGTVVIGTSITVSNEGELSYAQKVEQRIKRKKISNDAIASRYINLGILAGTSVACERLFSVAKNILTDTRKSTSPVVFEAILLLKMNRLEWDVHTMGRAMGRTTGERFVTAGGGTGISSMEIDADNVEDDDLFYST